MRITYRLVSLHMQLSRGHVIGLVSGVCKDKELGIVYYILLSADKAKTLSFIQCGGCNLRW